MSGADDDPPPWFGWHAGDGMAWVRVFGVGFHVKDVRRHPLLFSERNGRGLRVGRWRFKVLR